MGVCKVYLRLTSGSSKGVAASTSMVKQASPPGRILGIGRDGVASIDPVSTVHGVH